MKQKVIYLLSILVLSIIVLFWHIFLPKEGFYIWGIYFFSIPIIYSIAMFFRITRISIIIALSLIGVILSLLLSRDLINSYFFLKLTASLVGYGAVSLFHKRKN